MFIFKYDIGTTFSNKKFIKVRKLTRAVESCFLSKKRLCLIKKLSHDWHSAALLYDYQSAFHTHVNKPIHNITFTSMY